MNRQKKIFYAWGKPCRRWPDGEARSHRIFTAFRNPFKGYGPSRVKGAKGPRYETYAAWA